MQHDRRRHILIGTITFALSMMFLMAAAPATAAPAATFTVTSQGDQSDTAPGDGSCVSTIVFCTLRAAIEESNALAGADEIVIDPVINLLNFNPATPYPITSEITITGNGSANTIIDGNSNSQLFTVSAAGTLSLSDMTLREGSATTGGAILNAGTLTLLGVELRENDATGGMASEGGGALFNSGSATLSDTLWVDNSAVLTSGSGGAIFNSGTLSADNSTFTGNDSARAGGAIETIASASVALNAVTMNENSTGPNPGNGGALHMTGAGSVTISASTISTNSAALEGGGLWNGSGTMSVSDSTITNNSANGVAAHDGGGGLFNNGGALTVSTSTIANNRADGTSGSGGGIFNNVGGTLIVKGGVIENNHASRAGGGIEDNATPPAAGEGESAAPAGGFSVQLNAATFRNNQTGGNPGNGGALHVTGPGNVGVFGGVVENNQAASEGGGLWNSGAGTMMVNGVTVEGNTAQGNDSDNGGGGIFNDGGSLTVMATSVLGNEASGTSGSGGGVLNVNGGDLTVQGSWIMSNHASRAGGGIEDNSTLAATSTTISTTDLAGNTAGANPGNGGGYHATGAGTTFFASGRVFDNSATNEGGGLWNGTGTMTVTATLIENNIASGAAADTGGGGLHNNGGTLTVSDTVIRGNEANGAAGSGGGILNDAGGTLTVSASEISGNRSMRAGGGIEDNAGAGMLLTGVNLSFNETGDAPGNGGGLHITGAGSVTVKDSTVSGNIATEGGGLWNSAAGTLTVDGSTVNGNSADGTAAGQDGGGGIYNDGALMVFNSTISGNSSAAPGGGISVVGAAGVATVTNVTIYQNSAAIGASGVANNGGAVTLANSIVAHTAGSAPDCSGAVTATSPNLATDSSCGATVVADPMLGALANNGGATRTHLPAASSPALNAADGAICAAAPVSAVDQRDQPRPQGDGCDLGAVETAGGGGGGNRMVYFPLIQRAP